MKATVKVMNSWNYHNYTIEIEEDVDSLHDIDDMRIDAQVLVDHAIKQKKEADKHEQKLNSLHIDLNHAKQELEIAKERHGKPKPKGFFDKDNGDEGVVDLQDFSFTIHELENQITQLQFQIDNWKPFDYNDEECRLAEKAGAFDE